MKLFFALLPILAHLPLQGSEQKVPQALDSSPALSERIASYRMEVRLDPRERTVRGFEILTWKNQSEHRVGEFWFHLYLNAFKNNRSTFIQEAGLEMPWKGVTETEEIWGYTRIGSIEVLPDGELPVPEISGSGYVRPDDGDDLDQTVWRVLLSRPLEPGRRIRFRIEFVSKLPRGTRRTGWVEDYFFMAQWFPKIGIWKDGAWNCHQYHNATEYFADYGVYDVSMTVPSHFIVGATGKRIDQRKNRDGTTTYRYYQADVHDFAWTTNPRFLERKRRFTHPGLPPVEVTLLLLPEHEHLQSRYFDAVMHAIRYFGEWFGPYPYPTLTVVDPAYKSATGGMEYPTFITGRTHSWAPQKVLSPEGVTIHEFGHQYWYGLVANNEFEEAWLDEGINSWAEARVQKQAYEPSRYLERFFWGIPLVFQSVKIPFETTNLRRLRVSGDLDVMVRPGWKYHSRRSYLVNSYSKPEIALWTLERILGEELMLKVMRTYYRRYRFQHPTTKDFVSTVDEVTGRDMRWFFEQTFFSSELVDYAVETVRSEPIPPRKGMFDLDGLPTYVSREEQEKKEKERKTYRTEVVVRRLGGARLPVDVLMVFENGEQIRRHWDGQYRWQRYKFEKSVRLQYAVVDPLRKLLLDIDPTTNSRWVEKGNHFSLATKKWTAKWLFWLQNLLETFAFIS